MIGALLRITLTVALLTYAWLTLSAAVALAFTLLALHAELTGAAFTQLRRRVDRLQFDLTRSLNLVSDLVSKLTVRNFGGES